MNFSNEIFFIAIVAIIAFFAWPPSKTMRAPVVEVGDPVLRQRAKEIKVEDIQKPETQDLITLMKNTLDYYKGGLAMAAPQIGVSKRIFIVKPEGVAKNLKHTVYINPKLIYLSKAKEWRPNQGCMSVWGYEGLNLRSTKATVKAYDEHGKLFEETGEGVIAHIFQHETEHLNGILFIDCAKEIRWDAKIIPPTAKPFAKKLDIEKYKKPIKCLKKD